MHFLDWAIVVAYLAYVAIDGVRRSHSTERISGYFLANRSLPWWAVGLSIMATQMSAITLVGTTGQAYADGMRFIQFYFGLPFAMILLCLTVVPFFHRANVYTAYEYLERRFDARTRTLTSLFFLFSRGLSCGVIISAPAVILSIVLGWNLSLTVLAIGIPTIIYTMLGGVQAVTWTDVKQMVLIFVGMIAVLVVIWSRFPDEVSLLDALSLAGTAGQLETFDFTVDFNRTYTFWSGLLGGFFLMLSYFGCDQSQVQRYLTARSVNEGRISLLMSAFLKIPIQFVILLIGVLVFVFFLFHQPPLTFNPIAQKQLSSSSELRALNQEFQQQSQELRRAAIALAQLSADTTAREVLQLRWAYREALARRQELRLEALALTDATDVQSSLSDINYVFPNFVVNQLPIGVVGLLIAAIFAAAMSSISSELNSLATASTIDFYRRRFRPGLSERHYLWFSRFATGFWGLLACLVAFYATHLGSLIEVVNRFGSFFYGSLLGVFVLAIGTRWATGAGASLGLLAGMSAVAVVSWTTEISFLWYNVVGALTVIATALIVRLVAPTIRTEV